MLTDAFLARLDALRLAVRGAAQGGAGGARRSRALGASAEFSDFREYAPGDDIRRLDWNAYARFDRLFLKLFQEEREAAVTVLLDCSGSMAAKWETACKAAEALSYLALIGGDRARLCFLSEEGPRPAPFFAGRAAYPRFAQTLAREAPAGALVLAECLKRVEPCPPGLSLLITDGYQEGGLGPALDLLRYRRQECAVVHVLSPQETRPQAEGALRLKDAEGGPDLELSADGPALRAYEAALQDFLRSARGDCARRGAPYLLLTGDAPFEQAFPSALAQSALMG